MTEKDILRMFLARRENYAVSRILPMRGHLYTVAMGEETYTMVVLLSSFQFYEKRYHIAQRVPSLVVCFDHDTVVPVTVLSLRAGNLAKPYELPEGVTDVAAQRFSKRGSRCLLGMYLSGVRTAQVIVNGLPPTTRKRYLEKVKALGKRKKGKPVGAPMKKAERSTRGMLA